MASLSVDMKEKEEDLQEEHDLEMDSDSSDSDSENESSSNEDDEEEGNNVMDSGETDRLEIQLRESPFDFNINLSYLNSLRQTCNNHSQIRSARIEMSKKFPLSENVWLDWFKDEEKYAKNNEERQEVIELYQRALKDFVSVSLWCGYCSYLENIFFEDGLWSIEPQKTDSNKESESKTNETNTDKRDLSTLSFDQGLKIVRENYENAVTACGLDVENGARIWDKFRTFEQRILAHYTELMSVPIMPNNNNNDNDNENNSSSSSNNNNSQITKQTQVIRNLYKRQLSLPLKRMEKTLEDYESWESSLVSDSEGFPPPIVVKKERDLITRAYQTALSALNERLPFETSISTNKKATAWLDYVKFEEQKGNPSRVTIVYERAVKSIPNSLLLWQDFLRYLKKQFHNNPILWLNNYLRATRNCYWSGDIWSDYILTLEKIETQNININTNTKFPTVIEVFNQGLVAGLKSHEELYKLFLSYFDYNRRFLSSTYTDEGVESFRKILEWAVSYFAGSEFVLLIKKYWANLEAAYFANDEASRELWKDIVKESNSDYKTSIDYINLERYFFRDYEKARVLFKKAASNVKDEPQKIWSEWLQFERETGTLENFEAAKEEVTKKSTELIEKKIKEELINQEILNEKKQQRKDKRKEDEKKKGKGKEKEGKGKGKFGDKKRERGKDDRNLANKQGSSKRIQFSSERVMLHVSNFPFSVTNKSLGDFFAQEAQLGEFEVHLATEHNGKSRGFATLEVFSEDDQNKALSLSGNEWLGRKIFITKSKENTNKDEAEQKKFHSDQFTLFVKNLSRTVSVEDVRKHFETYGEVKDVRFVYEKDKKGYQGYQSNGGFKGIAYVEFNDEETTTKALESNGKEVFGRRISVEKSRPPKPLRFDNNQNANTNTDNNNNNNNNDDTKDKPTKISEAKIEKLLQVISPPSSSTPPTTTPSQLLLPRSMKSNSDFRQMLLAKK